MPATRRPGGSSTVGAALVLAALSVVALTACSSHPVGPARTYASFEAKAETTAESALSAVETVRLAARAGAEGKATGPYLGQVISDQEEGLSSTEGTFGSIQPPDGRADRLRAELDDLLSQSVDHVVAVRVAVRRGALNGLGTTARPLDADAKALRSFVEAHR
jgi:hypothetical protein